MDKTTILGQLEELAKALGIQIRREALEHRGPFSPGGLCRINERPVLIINSKASTGDQIHTLVHALRRFDLSQIYLRPVLRDLLEGSMEEEKGEGYFLK